MGRFHPSILKTKKVKLMNRIKRFLLAICGLVAVANTSAKEYEVRTTCPESVKLGESFKIAYQLAVDSLQNKATIGKVNVENGQITYGPKMATSTNVSVIGGKFSKNTTYTFNLAIQANDKDVVIEPVDFDVLLSDSVVGHAKSERLVVKVDSVGEVKREQIIEYDSIKPDDIFVKWECSRDKITLGDTIQCVCNLYYDVSVLDVVHFEMSNFDDCLVLCDTMGNPDERTKKVNLNGREYDCYTLLRYVLKPLRTGTFSVDGGEATLAVRVKEKPKKNAIFPDGFFTVYHKKVEYQTRVAGASFKVKGKAKPIKSQRVKGTDDVYLLCKMSLSMNTLDFTPDRKGAVANFAESWFKKVEHSGYATFASCIGTISKPNEKPSKIDTSISCDRPGTATGDALLKLSESGEKCKDIIIITDGSSNTGRFSLNTALEIVRSKGIRVSFVYVNSGTDKVDYMIDGKKESLGNYTLKEKDINKIREAVESTGGIFVEAKSNDELLGLLPQLKALVSSKRECPKADGCLYDAKLVKEGLELLKEE